MGDCSCTDITLPDPADEVGSIMDGAEIGMIICGAGGGIMAT